MLNYKLTARVNQRHLLQRRRRNSQKYSELALQMSIDITFYYQQRDIITVDNFIVIKGSCPWKDERKITVSMWNTVEKAKHPP